MAPTPTRASSSSPAPRRVCSSVPKRRFACCYWGFLAVFNYQPTALNLPTCSTILNYLNTLSSLSTFAEWLDGKHVVFGRVMDAESMLTVRKIEAVPTAGQNRPRLDVVVTECGEL